MTHATTLVVATDAHYAWLARGGAEPFDGLRVPPGGVDEPATVAHVRAIARRLRDAGRSESWLIVAASEVVGLCGFVRPPDTRGTAEIGYGVAPSRRRRGHATQAIREMLLRARTDATIAALTAQVLTTNVGSERALDANGFVRTGTWTDAREGDVGTWRAETTRAS